MNELNLRVLEGPAIARLMELVEPLGGVLSGPLAEGQLIGLTLIAQVQSVLCLDGSLGIARLSERLSGIIRELSKDLSTTSPRPVREVSQDCA